MHHDWIRRGVYKRLDDRCSASAACRRGYTCNVFPGPGIRWGRTVAGTGNIIGIRYIITPAGGTCTADDRYWIYGHSYRISCACASAHRRSDYIINQNRIDCRIYKCLGNRCSGSAACGRRNSRHFCPCPCIIRGRAGTAACDVVYVSYAAAPVGRRITGNNRGRIHGNRYIPGCACACVCRGDYQVMHHDRVSGCVLQGFVYRSSRTGIGRIADTRHGSPAPGIRWGWCSAADNS